jgi:enamine deaminase RidA (YjgF/YER057c/UK114 family)
MTPTEGSSRSFLGLGRQSKRPPDRFSLAIALAAGGADFTHLVKLTIYALDASYWTPIAEVRKKHLGWPDPVASTFLVVAGLALPGLLLEIDAVAVVDPD